MSHSRGVIASRRRRSAVLLLVLLVALPSGIASTSAAQEAPRPVCVAGETPGDRINAIIGVLIGHFTLSSILASGLTVDPSDPSGNTLFDLCPSVAVLQHFDRGYLPPLLGLLSVDVWEHALKGESLAEIGKAQGVNREALIEALQSGYSEALDTALAADEITGTQRQRLAARILPQFNWMVDWAHGDALPVDISGLDSSSVNRVLPGANETERSENVLRLIAGLPVATASTTADSPAATEPAAVWTTFGAEITAVIAPDGNLTPEDLYAEYLSGKSLIEIHAEHGGDPETLTATLTDALSQALDAEVAAGNLTVVEREQLEAVLLATIEGTIKHHVGDPLPNDLSGGTGDDQVAALAVAGPSCQGVPATVVAVGAGPIVSGPFGDVIVGTNGNDTIDGGGGVDLICGLDGNDTIEGGQGRDTIYADEGADLVYGEGSGIVVTGGGDTIHGGGGNDHLLGQVGDDDLFGDGGNDEIEGGDGADELFGGNGDDDLDGDSGNDTCTGGNGVDTFSQC